MLTMVHIRHFNCERWEAVLVHRSFANILSDPLSISRYKGS